MTEDYEIGYRKPPKHTRFKKGRSGNPAGRPKGTKNLKTDLQEELQETISISEQGKVKTVSKQRAMVKSLLARALKGEPRSAALVVNMCVRLFQDQSEAVQTGDLTQADNDILSAFEAEVRRAVASAKEGGDVG